MRKELNDSELYRLLDGVRAPGAPEDMAARVALRALAQPQRRGWREVLTALLAAIWSDLLGDPGDLPLYNRNWRLAGALAMLLLGFSAGYLAQSPQGTVLPSLYVVDDSGGMDVI